MKRTKPVTNDEVVAYTATEALEEEESKSIESSVASAAAIKRRKLDEVPKFAPVSNIVLTVK